MANISQSEILLKNITESLYKPIFKKETEFLPLFERLIYSYHIFISFLLIKQTSFAISETKIRMTNIASKKTIH